MSYTDITEARWGRDLVLVDEDAGGVASTPTGDWPTVAGRPNLHAAHRRRATTSPGQLLCRPDYGAGMLGFVGASTAPAERVRLAQAVRLNALRDPRIAEVGVAVQLDAQQRVIAELTLSPRGEPSSDSVTIVAE